MPARQTRSGLQPVMSPSSRKIRPARRPQLAADQIDEARLAGAVRTDDDVAFARLDREADAVGDDKAAERAVEPIGAQQAHARALVRSWRNVPQMPPGKNITQAMKMTPMIISQCSL